MAQNSSSETPATAPCPAGAIPLRRRSESPVEAAIRSAAPVVTTIRHQVHRNPELANREFRTAAVVAEHLRDAGFEVITGVAHTGVIGLLRGSGPGPVVAARADMDALPVREDSSYPFRSTVRTHLNNREVWVSHACGHDLHAAVLLGVASVLGSMREQIRGAVKLIFQPAEEGAPPGEDGGAKLMVKQGALEGPRPEAIFALHSDHRLEVGEVGVTPGPAMAAVDRFDAVLRGRQSHGAAPHTAVDPVIMAAEAVMALQTVPSRSVDPLTPCVLSVGSLNAGQAFNIIPEEVTLEGTVRTYDADVSATVERRIREILAGVAGAHGGSYEMKYRRLTPVLVNDEELCARAATVLERVFGVDKLSHLPQTMGGEDFAEYTQEVPGFFFRLGTVRPGTTSGPLHSPDFVADDSAIPVGMRALTEIILDFLNTPPDAKVVAFHA
jgi:amidohydrolase